MKILVSKPDALGDQVLATGFVQALQLRWPESRIVWHVRDGMEVIADLLEATSVFRPNRSNSPAVEASRLWAETTTSIVVVPYPIHPFSEWTPELEAHYGWWGEFVGATKWDLAMAPVVNRTGLSDFTVTISGATRRVAFATNPACQPMIEAVFTHLPARKADFTDETPSSLQDGEWQQHARMLQAIDPKAQLCPPVLRIREEVLREARLQLGSGRPVLIAPGVGENFQRAWPLEQFVRVAAGLRSQGHDVRWIEGPRDATLFSRLPAGESSARLAIPANRLDLLAALVAEAQLLLCNDTAYVHLGAALGTPTVAIYGAGQKGRFVPQFGRVRVVQGDPVCRGCQWQCAFPRHLCAQDVPYTSVWAALEAQREAPQSLHTRVPVPLPFSGAADSFEELEHVRDWFQLELDRLRWDGWARLQIINDVLERLKTRDTRIAALTAERDAFASRLDQETPATGAMPAAGALPKLSVIIPMGRPERATGTLQSLARQSLMPPEWELVVVGVGASRLRSVYPQLPLVPVDLEHNVLPPRTRAEGVARATGDWFVFVDDDVQLAPDFFEMLARVLATGIVGQAPVGAIGVRLPGGRGTFFEHLTDISNFWSQQSPIRAVPHTVWFLYSAAIVVRAEAYRKAGGFNPELPNAEDVDLTQRIAAAGYVLAYEPSLVAHHHHGRDSLLRMWRYFWKNGNTARYFFAHHGGVCCFSLRTAWVRAWRDLQMNRSHQKAQRSRLGLRLPWVYVNYLIFEHSLEWHYQHYLWTSKCYRDLPARSASDRNTVAAFAAFETGRRLAGISRYVLALVQNPFDPVRR